MTWGVTESDFNKNIRYLYPGYTYNNAVRHVAQFHTGAEPPLIDFKKLYDPEVRIKDYEDRNARIKKYFMRAPEKLLVIDITKEETTQKICAFLGIPEGLVIPVPHLNKT